MTNKRERTWRCSKCKMTVTCIGVVEGHRCPSNQSRWVSKWELVEEEEHVVLVKRRRIRYVA